MSAQSASIARDVPERRSRDPFWRVALVWLPALNVVALCLAGSIGSSARTLLVAAALLALGELTLLIVKARHRDVGAVQVAAAVLANAAISITVMILVFTIACTITCGPGCGTRK